MQSLEGLSEVTHMHIHTSFDAGEKALGQLQGTIWPHTDITARHTARGTHQFTHSIHYYREV